MAHALRNSRVGALAKQVSRQLSADAGVVLLAAAITHVMAMLLSRPSQWYWVTLPSIVILVATALRFRDRAVLRQ